ncbi:iron-containing alcohol dehydrogenase [Halobacillus salinus]|uniref:Iron-containing alcohol dehydrogenase n=1 Tax=Halobacillus salinus TaxID=192814 RepID=A0A4Z0GUW3_9BACI|nr:iron-containing alcohol dehydrogenase [Halobacillus salinus]TGB01430.1 iron-containing alcohol dehydrogenase [Halobacillus salinus]
MYSLYCRIYQRLMKIALYLLPWRKPALLEGENSLDKLPSLIKEKGLQRILIVTDRDIPSLGLMDPLLQQLRDEEIHFYIYDQTVPNPTIENVEEALDMYRQQHCEGIVAFGGGSPMDCAKGVGARVARPDKLIPKLKGILKIRKELPPLFAVPTTAGTGSEATLAAVLSNVETHEKFVLMDHSLIPHYAVLDPLLTVKLPPHLTAATGMDALTHAVEAYIGKSNTKETVQCSKEAVKLIFENLRRVYEDGANIGARTNMQKASYLAGVAFTRAYVGNVHAIAHTLGGFYSFPHGLANAIILPYVLEYYGKSAHKPLSELADLVGVSLPGDTVERKARRFIEAVKQLNQDIGIPLKVSGIAEEHIPVMAGRALKEANPLYPVPRIMKRNEMVDLYHTIKE